MMNDMTYAIKVYQHQIEALKPLFLKMILDTYIDWNTFENEDDKADRFSRMTKESLEDYIKGHELDQWNNLLQKLNENQTIQNNFNDNSRQTIEIKQQDYLKLEDIPKKVIKNVGSYNFKSRDKNPESKILNLVLKPDHLKQADQLDNRYVNFINNDKNEEHSSNLIKICDYNHDNRLIFLDKFNISFRDKDNDPVISGKINMNTLEKRSDILVNSRYNFVEKTAITISKLIISMKKLAKLKKEKESRKTENKCDHSLLQNKVDQAGTNSDKFKKIKERNYIDLDKSVYSNTKNIDIDNFKNFLNKIKTEKREKEEKDSKMREESLKMKLKTIKEKIDLEKKKEDENVVLFDFNQNSNKFKIIEIDDNNKLEEEHNSITNINNTQIDNLLVNEDDNQPFAQKERNSSAHKNRNLINFQSQISEVLKDIKEEKTIVPKKKVNYVGLKMYLKEVLKNK